LKILFNAYGQGFGGNFFHAYYLSTSLYEILGDEILILCDEKMFEKLSKSINKQNLLNIGPSVIGIKKTLNQEFLLNKIIHKERIELFHQIGQLPIRQLECKTIANIADIDHFKDENTNLFRKVYKEISYKLTIHKSNHIICPSHYTKNQILKNYKIKGENISVIYHGVGDLPQPTYKIISNLKNKYWLSFGHLANKNCETAIKSLNQFNYINKTNHKLVVIGYSKYTENVLKPWVSDNNFENIIFVGKIESSELHSLYLNAEGLLFLSIYEGFGIPVIEAMKYKCPVIISNMTSLPEIAGNSTIICNAYDYEEIAENMESLSNNSKYRESVITDSQDHVKDMTWPNVARNVITVYNKLLE